jgi:hypothetical protein
MAMPWAVRLPASSRSVESDGTRHNHQRRGVTVIFGKDYFARGAGGNQRRGSALKARQQPPDVAHHPKATQRAYSCLALIPVGGKEKPPGRGASQALSGNLPGDEWDRDANEQGCSVGGKSYGCWNDLVCRSHTANQSRTNR